MVYFWYTDTQKHKYIYVLIILEFLYFNCSLCKIILKSCSWNRSMYTMNPWDLKLNMAHLGALTFLICSYYKYVLK